MGEPTEIDRCVTCSMLLTQDEIDCEYRRWSASRVTLIRIRILAQGARIATTAGAIREKPKTFTTVIDATPQKDDPPPVHGQ